MTQIIYGQTRPAYVGERTWSNARFFDKPVDGATAVFLDGDFPAIRAAYEAKGVQVHYGAPDPLDHDGDGEKGGAVEPAEPEPVRKPRRRRSKA